MEITLCWTCNLHMQLSLESSSVMAGYAVTWPRNSKKTSQPWSHTLSPVSQTIQTRYYLVYLLNMITTETSSGNDHSNRIWEMAVDSKTLSARDEWYHTWQRDCSRLACGKCQGVAAHLRRNTKDIFVCSRMGEIVKKKRYTFLKLD